MPSRRRPARPRPSTIIVGFGNLLPGERDSLNRLAQAGGVPGRGTNRYYEATDADSLNNKILNTMDTWSGDARRPAVKTVATPPPCPTGQACLNDECKPNPCTTQTCPTDQTCVFTSQGAVVLWRLQDPAHCAPCCFNGVCIPDRSAARVSRASC